jgi:hypothetical protein
MPIAALAMVKDEADIIELFVRINLDQIDHLYLVDNGSSDATREILARLQREGLPLTVWPYATLDYQQDIITTAALRKIALDGRHDWIVPIDADEFIQAEGLPLRDALARHGRTGTPAGARLLALPWCTYVPLDDGFAHRPQPLAEGFAPRAHEPRQFYKVVVPAALAEQCSLGMGNHELLDRDGRSLPMSSLAAAGLSLAHVPVRSAAQIMVKALVGSHKYSLKANRRSGEGFHWDALARQIRASGCRLDLGSLQHIALAYATQAQDDLPPLPQVARAIGSPTHARRWPELAGIDLASRLDALAADLCASLRQAYPDGLPTRMDSAGWAPPRPMTTPDPRSPAGNAAKELAQ